MNTNRNPTRRPNELRGIPCVICGSTTSEARTLYDGETVACVANVNGRDRCRERELAKAIREATVDPRDARTPSPMGRRAMTRRRGPLGLDVSREMRRSQRHKECTARGYHQRSRKVETKTMGGKPYSMELCAYCDVWVEEARPDWKELS